MSFASHAFLYGFLPVTLVFWMLAGRKHPSAQKTVLLICGLGFCAFAGLAAMLAMLLLALAIWLSGCFLEKAAEARSRKRRLILPVCLLLAVLGVYKYTGFVLENCNALFGLSLKAPTLYAPLGLSFLTFLGISYLADIYHGRCRAEKSFWNLLLYLTFFPKAAQGPLMRYADFRAQMAAPQVSPQNAADGAERFVIGLGKKLLLGDVMAGAAAEIFNLSAVALTPAKMWAGAFLFTWQIYFDFSGYTDMAVGLGMLFGYRLPENFNHPYMAVSVSDFWRRWHMTLSGWFRDYVYIPLGGNRRGKGRQILNLAVVWVLTGLWHGASWPFILWGAWFAVLLILEKTVLLKALEKLPVFVKRIYALFCVLIGWVIFNSFSVAMLAKNLSAMFGFGGRGNDAAYFALLLRQYWPELIAAVLLSTTAGQKLFEKLEKTKIGRIVKLLLLLAVLALSVLALTGSGMRAFIYAQF